MPATIRLARPSDRDALYRICLATGDAGQDAAQPGRDPELLGHLYAGPYLELQPDFAWVAEDEAGVSGYLLATPDSTDFYARMERDWLPPLRARSHAGHDPDGWLVKRLHSTWALDPRLADWPAHLHVDLLPRTQGQGVGARLMQAALDQLGAAGVAGVHLGVDPRNERALAWYARFGFEELFRQPGCVWFGRRLERPAKG
ncbi:GNAT family N-acetyltransferase [Chitinimonas koreensis]|uniref:GNAT family N-acetyltransferase n=1 Tax=Chitinimonas koreensis TaxID=356302 RepID=UPI000491C226|nr:GNAT family N-acetyltransferase [Chitinimonas koreensis]QNM94681.1 GNAT family N-acetyltransferase [Chitinimonas koreensis]